MKIKSIQFKNHSILGNLFVNFCDKEGKPVDTVLIAGENGTGKSTLLNEIYKILTLKIDNPLTLTAEVDNKEIVFDYYLKTLSSRQACYVKVGSKEHVVVPTYHPYEEHFIGIFSDVDIHFNTKPIANVTSLDIDTKPNSRRSNEQMTQEIQQLLIDIQALDDAKISQMIRMKKGEQVLVDESLLSGRMERFVSAFDYMFGGKLSYDQIKNVNSRKAILFRRNKTTICLDDLSSGEKQIVYRGSFLLKDINALNGAIVLIDEPEISLHPEWQKRIMEFYRKMFTDKNGKQTSQIFAVTHSPFVLHNEFRRNDKVIILQRAEDDTICVSDKPEYYSCQTIEAIRDAFHHEWVIPHENTVYVEGITDERYFNKAVEVYDLQLPFVFKWIGHKTPDRQEEFTGSDSLDKAYKFSLSANYNFDQIFLFDSDIKKKNEDRGKSHMRVLPQYENSRFKAGIENALQINFLPEVEWADFYEEKVTIGNYSEKKVTSSFRKREFCEFVCSLEKGVLTEVFRNLKSVIEMLQKIFVSNDSCAKI